MDFPVQETTGVDYTSRVDGAMHACGHDLHTSMLAGAATLLAERRDQLAGDVILMFQPGEEGFDGASYMIKEGVLDAAGRRADTAYGMHVFSSLEPHGQFVTKPGVMLSSSDGLVVTVLGAGGHGSAPYSAKDPVTAAAEMVTALQVMVTRQFNMFDPWSSPSASCTQEPSATSSLRPRGSRPLSGPSQRSPDGR
jgi:amidohydrolase